MRLPKDLISDLAIVRDLGPGSLHELNAEIVGAATSVVTTTGLLELLRKTLGDRPQTGSVFHVLVSLAGERRQSRLSVSGVLDQVQSALNNDARWSEEELQRWDLVRPGLAELLGSSQISYLVKALELRYDYANLLESSRIITDLRPVYNDDASEIDGLVVSFTLRLGFTGIDGKHGLSISLDESDVRNLLDECERAIRKGRTAKARMSQAQIRTSISGEKGDAEN
jgi:hypothetical protein